MLTLSAWRYNEKESVTYMRAALLRALIAANSSAIIADTFERHRIGRAYGFTGMSWNIGAL